jgi:cell division septation protein DedD
MKAKDFREIQVSSTLLVVIFLCVLVLGVFIFLLGVSVGKKQVEITAATRVVAQQIQEPAKDQASPTPSEQDQAKDKLPAATPSGSLSSAAPSSGPPSGHESQAKTQVEGKPTVKAPAGTGAKTPSKPAATSAGGVFYIQVAAFTDRAQAVAEADRFKKRGYPVVVADPRPTDTKTWYRVRVGSYSTREKAAEVLTKLNETAKKKTDYRIIKD